MGILFHCNYCGKKIEASNSAGGKWGKCPSCHNKIYVPDINADIDDIKLAPVDKDEEKKKRQLMAETYKLSQNILLEREESDRLNSSATQISDMELTKNIILYLRNMADGELEEAKKQEAKVIPYGKKTVQILERIAVSEMPEPELADIPTQVLSGLVRALSAKINI
jgi:hypothetical protein